MSNPEQVKCPNCGANLNVVPDASYFFCRYCGTKIETNLAKREIVHRIVDEAELEKTKARRERSMMRRAIASSFFEHLAEEQEAQETRAREKERRDLKISMWFCVIAGIFVLLMMLSGR